MARIVDLDEAAALLAAGAVVAIPTETVYGLAADATNEAALRQVFALKGRPLGNPLIVHLPDAIAAQDWANGTGDPAVTALLARFWPGPLTVVLPARPTVLPLVTAGSGQVALRVPAHPLARALLARFGGALCAPSANRSGYVSPTCAAHVLADYPDHDLAVLDGGDCPGGIESTIVRPLGAAREMSLFASSRLIEIRIPSGKPGKEGSEALQRYAESLPDGVVTVADLIAYLTGRVILSAAAEGKKLTATAIAPASKDAPKPHAHTVLAAIMKALSRIGAAAGAANFPCVCSIPPRMAVAQISGM